MGQSIVECELLTGTRSAEGIMASGPVSRTDRPNTWLLRPALRRDRSLDNPEPSTHGPKLTQIPSKPMSAYAVQTDFEGSVQIRQK